MQRIIERNYCLSLILQRKERYRGPFYKVMFTESVDLYHLTNVFLHLLLFIITTRESGDSYPFYP